MPLIPYNCPCVGDQGLPILRQFSSDTTTRSVILILPCNRNLDDVSQRRLYTQGQLSPLQKHPCTCLSTNRQLHVQQQIRLNNIGQDQIMRP